MFTQILFNSVLSALFLSVVAIGFNLVFNTTKVFHLAHGALYTVSIYTFYHSRALLEKAFSPAWAVSISLLLVLAFVVLLAVAMEYLVYRPLYLKKVNPVISLISSLGIYLLLVNVLTFCWGSEAVTLNNQYHIVLATPWLRVTDMELLQISTVTPLLLVLLYFRRTKAYTAIRSVTYSYPIAEKFGISIGRTRLLALAIAAASIAIAGILKGYETAVDPEGGLALVLTASVAVIIGGVYSIKGTLLACLLIALVQNFSVTIWSAQWKDTITYTLLILVVIFYQQGLIAIKQRVETT